MHGNLTFEWQAKSIFFYLLHSFVRSFRFLCLARATRFDMNFLISFLHPFFASLPVANTCVALRRGHILSPLTFFAPVSTEPHSAYAPPFVAQKFTIPFPAYSISNNGSANSNSFPVHEMRPMNGFSPGRQRLRVRTSTPAQKAARHFGCVCGPRSIHNIYTSLLKFFVSRGTNTPI